MIKLWHKHFYIHISLSGQRFSYYARGHATSESDVDVSVVLRQDKQPTKSWDVSTNFGYIDIMLIIVDGMKNP